VIKGNPHVNFPFIGRVFGQHVEAQGGKVAVKDRGIIPFVARQLILAIPIMRNRRKKSVKNVPQTLKVARTESLIQIDLADGFFRGCAGKIIENPVRQTLFTSRFGYTKVYIISPAI
jgi:hypothetical protein